MQTRHYLAMLGVVVLLLLSAIRVTGMLQDPRYFLPADRVSVRVMSEVPPVDVAPGVHVRTVVGGTGSFSIGDFDSGAAAALHHHTREQADVGITGMLDMTIGTHVETLGPGAAVIVPPNVAHSIANEGTGVMTVIEFHTVRRPDLVPPRPALTFAASPEPVPVPDDRALVVKLDQPAAGSSATTRTIRGETCTLTWRRLPREAKPTDIQATAKEVFIYIVRGAAELGAMKSRQRVTSGALVVIPPQERVTLQAAGATDVALVEFAPER